MLNIGEARGDSGGELQLYLMCQKGDTSRVKQLIKQGANVNAINNEGDAPLHWACMGGHIGVVSWLIKKRASVNALNNKRETPLHWACMGSHTEMIKLLIKQGANVNIARYNDGATPLYCACMGGAAEEIIKLLIEHGANVNTACEDGLTPLHWACTRRHNTKIVELLIKKGANVDAIQDNGATPLHWACTKGHTEIARRLIYSTLLQNPLAEKPAFVVENEELSIDWDQKLGQIGNLSLKLGVPLQGFMTKKIGVSARSTKKKNLKHLQESHKSVDCASYCVEKRLKNVISYQEKIDEKIEFMVGNPYILSNVFSSKESGQRNSHDWKNRFQFLTIETKKETEVKDVQLHEYVIRNILSYLSLRDLNSLIKACRILSSTNKQSHQIGFFESAGSSISNDDSKSTETLFYGCRSKR